MYKYILRVKIYCRYRLRLLLLMNIGILCSAINILYHYVYICKVISFIAKLYWFFLQHNWLLTNYWNWLSTLCNKIKFICVGNCTHYPRQHSFKINSLLLGSNIMVKKPWPPFPAMLTHTIWINSQNNHQNHALLHLLFIYLFSRLTLRESFLFRKGGVEKRGDLSSQPPNPSLQPQKHKANAH